MSYTSGKKSVTEVNAKAAVGRTKVPMNSLPPAGRIHGAIAAKFGNDKYGFYNYRKSKVSMMMYLDAIERHLLQTLDGEDLDQESKAMHLGHIIADASIILDAIEHGNIVDDRPPKGTAAKILKRERAK